MRKYQVLSTNLAGKGNKIFSSGDVVGENHFYKGHAEKLADQKHLKRLFDERTEFYEGENQHLNKVFSHCRSKLSIEEIKNIHQEKIISKISDETPVLSAILPLFRAKEIAFVVLESLCRQEKAPFWELVVIEEDFDNSLTFDGIQKYAARLSNAGCVQITYIKISEWMPLSAKWYYLIQNTSPSSQVICFNSADVYCPAQRLEKQYSVLTSGYNWYRISGNIIYDIETGIHVKRSSIERTKGDTVCRATTREMALRLPLQSLKKSVDGWTFNTFKYFGIVQYTDDSDISERSVNVNGINNISLDRGQRVKRMPVCCTDINNHLPAEITKSLTKAKSKISAHKHLIDSSLVKI